MDAIFRDWAIKRVERELTENPVTKQAFLRKLKFEPLIIKQFFDSAFLSWGFACSTETDTVISHNLRNDASDFLKALQAHFAKELAEIPDKPVTVPQ